MALTLPPSESFQICSRPIFFIFLNPPHQVCPCLLPRLGSVQLSNGLTKLGEPS